MKYETCCHMKTNAFHRLLELIKRSIDITGLGNGVKRLSFLADSRIQGYKSTQSIMHVDSAKSSSETLRLRDKQKRVLNFAKFGSYKRIMRPFHWVQVELRKAVVLSCNQECMSLTELDLLVMKPS